MNFEGVEMFVKNITCNVQTSDGIKFYLTSRTFYLSMFLYLLVLHRGKFKTCPCLPQNVLGWIDTLNRKIPHLEHQLLCYHNIHKNVTLYYRQFNTHALSCHRIAFMLGMFYSTLQNISLVRWQQMLRREEIGQSRSDPQPSAEDRQFIPKTLKRKLHVSDSALQLWHFYVLSMFSSYHKEWTNTFYWDCIKVWNYNWDHRLNIWYLFKSVVAA